MNSICYVGLISGIVGFTVGLASFAATCYMAYKLRQVVRVKDALIGIQQQHIETLKDGLRERGVSL